MSALKGLVSVSFCVSNQHEKTESHLLTSTRRPQRKAAPLCEQWSQTCATYVVIGTVVWSFIHIAVLLNATALTCFKHIKTGRKETHRKKCKRDESSIRQQKLCHFWFPSHVFKHVLQHEQVLHVVVRWEPSIGSLRAWFERSNFVQAR